MRDELCQVLEAKVKGAIRGGISNVPQLSQSLVERALTSPTIGVLIVAILGLCAAPRAGMDSHFRKSVLALAVIMATSLFPDILFTAFGQRHLLGTKRLMVNYTR